MFGSAFKEANRSSIRTLSSSFATQNRSAFASVSMSTNGFLLNRELLADLEEAGLDQLQISVDRMTPIASTRKSMKSIVHKLDWFKESKID